MKGLSIDVDQAVIVYSFVVAKRCLLAVDEQLAEQCTLVSWGVDRVEQRIEVMAGFFCEDGKGCFLCGGVKPILVEIDRAAAGGIRPCRAWH